MISIPLFKQSIKANWGMWTAITVATCFILTVIMIAVGGNSINNIMGSIGDAFVKNSIKCEIENASMNYYYTASVSADGYEAGIGSVIPSYFTEEDLIDSITQNIAGGVKEKLIKAGENENDAETASKTVEDFIKAFLSEYSAYRNYLTDPSARTAFVAGFVSELLGETMPEQLLENGLTGQELLDYNFISEEIKKISGSAIVNFCAQISTEYPASEYPNLSVIALRHPGAIEERIENLTASVLSELPDDAQNNMDDMQNLELTQMMTGTVFFKIAGLLLPVIYIIMVSISLIAGQVDSGSMAYIVSTPVKRRTVTLTQMAFMVSSLFAMCLCITATGLICLALVGESSISYTQMIYLNIASFATMFTFAGICFFASAWFNRSKYAMAIGGGISMYFVVATIMGMFGSPEMPSLIRMDSMNIFNYTTITGLFDGASIFANTTDFIPKLAILSSIGLAGFIIGILRFNKKDLPL